MLCTSCKTSVKRHTTNMKTIIRIVILNFPLYKRWNSIFITVKSLVDIFHQTLHSPYTSVYRLCVCVFFVELAHLEDACSWEKIHSSHTYYACVREVAKVVCLIHFDGVMIAIFNLQLITFLRPFRLEIFRRYDNTNSLICFHILWSFYLFLFCCILYFLWNLKHKLIFIEDSFSWFFFLSILLFYINWFWLAITEIVLSFFQKIVPQKMGQNELEIIERKNQFWNIQTQYLYNLLIFDQFNRWPFISFRFDLFNLLLMEYLTFWPWRLELNQVGKIYRAKKLTNKYAI